MSSLVISDGQTFRGRDKQLFGVAGSCLVVNVYIWIRIILTNTYQLIVKWTAALRMLLIIFIFKLGSLTYFCVTMVISILKSVCEILRIFTQSIMIILAHIFNRC